MRLVNKHGASLVAFLGIALVASIWLLIVSSAVYGSVYWYFRPQYVIRMPLEHIAEPNKRNFFEGTYRSRNMWTFKQKFPIGALQHENYVVSLEFYLPPTYSNRDAGNFVSTLSLGNFSSHQAAAEYSLMSILPYKGPIVEAIDQMLFAPLYLLGLKNQVEFVSGEFDTIIKTPNQLYKWLKVTIDREIDISSATLVWSAKLTGFRRFMYYNPFISCFIFIGVLWFFGMVVTITVCLLTYLGSESKEPKEPKTRVESSNRSSGRSSGMSSGRSTPRPSSASFKFEWNGSRPRTYSTFRKAQASRPSSRTSSRALSRASSGTPSGTPSRGLYRPHRTIQEIRANDTTQDESQGWQEETEPTIHGDFTKE